MPYKYIVLTALGTTAFILAGAVFSLSSTPTASAACTLTFDQVWHHRRQTKLIKYDFSQARHGLLTITNNTDCSFPVIARSTKVHTPPGVNGRKWGIQSDYRINPAVIIPAHSTKTVKVDVPKCNTQVDWYYEFERINGKTHKKPLAGRIFHDKSGGYCPQPTVKPTPEPTPKPTPHPTHQPKPTHKPYPTFKPVPTDHPWPTKHPYPTYEPQPTHTPTPTHKPNPYHYNFTPFTWVTTVNASNNQFLDLQSHRDFFLGQSASLNITNPDNQLTSAQGMQGIEGTGPGMFGQSQDFGFNSVWSFFR